MITLGAIAKKFELELCGDPDVVISGVCSLQPGVSGCLAFMSNRALASQLPDCLASVVIVPPDFSDARPNLLLSGNPSLAYARVATLFMPAAVFKPGIHSGAVVADDVAVSDSVVIAPNAVVEPGAVLGERVSIGPGAVVGAGATIGDDSSIAANVVIGSGVSIGLRVQIHEGAVIGSRGFGNARDGAQWVAIPQLGSVIIGDDVEIGANTTIDRGAVDDTVLCNGVKIDNLVQIGHNVFIGKDSAVAGYTGIAGSARIGERCMIGGGVGIAGHLSIADEVMVMGGSRVLGDIRESGAYGSGGPIMPAAEWRRQMVRVKRLCDMEKRVKELEKRLNRMTESSTDLKKDGS